MTLVDTSVWSRHFRRRDDQLVRLLADAAVAVHPWILGELALGPGLRLDVLDDLGRLPIVLPVGDAELMEFIRLHALRGVGWVDAQLLLAALRSRTPLWTLDAGLGRLADRFDIGWASAPDTR